MPDFEGYHAKVEHQPNEGLLSGCVLGTRDTVVFEAETATEGRAAFGGAVDDSLDFCAERETGPRRPRTIWRPRTAKWTTR